MEALKNFYVTFGVKYRFFTHPVWIAADPDGVLKVMAPSLDTATAATQIALGTNYAFIYPEAEMAWKYHPQGVIGTITYTGIVDII